MASREVKIYCPKCKWEPRQSSQWMCGCRHTWNTFDTGGVCPNCGKVWTETQCLSCHKWSAHSDWYHEFISEDLSTRKESTHPAEVPGSGEPTEEILGSERSVSLPVAVQTSIGLAVSSDVLARCFSVMHELRPHLTANEFLSRVQRQQKEGYQLVFLEAGGEIRSVAGYRIVENLAWSRFLYVDDLVTRSSDHGTGFGSTLFDWLVQQAITADCQQLHLDSGVQRFGAHRFYLHKGMDITSHHFAISIAGE